MGNYSLPFVGIARFIACLTEFTFWRFFNRRFAVFDRFLLSSFELEQILDFAGEFQDNDELATAEILLLVHLS